MFCGVHRIEVIARAHSQIAYELDIPMDLAEDVVSSNLSPNALRVTAVRFENYYD